MKKKGEQFLQGGLGLNDLHPALGGTKVPEYIDGPVAQHIMDRAGIEFSRNSPEHGGRWEGNRLGTGVSRMPDADEPLVTDQPSLHAPSLQAYAAGEIPNSEESADRDPLPEVWHDKTTDKVWVNDGHHRIIADRLGENQQRREQL